MGSWKVAGWGGVCGLGALSFLRIVAYEVERTEQGLSAKNAKARKERDRLLREASESEEPVVIQAVGSGAGGREFVVRN